MNKPNLSLQDTGRIYLDHNATTAPLLSVVEHLPEWAKLWGNPSSIHWSGRGPKNVIRDARAKLAAALGVHPLEIVFTSGGSEANNTVIRGFFATEHNRRTYITSRVEHPSVLRCFEHIESQGARVIYLNVNRGGQIDLAQYESALSEEVALVSIMAANNETGTVFPVSKMAKLAHSVGAFFHTDAVQALGKIPVNLTDWGVDFASFAGHKVYSLKGAGFVYSKKGRRLQNLILGGGQERGRRAGTENTLAIAALGHVAEKLSDILQHNQQTTSALRDEFEKMLESRVCGVYKTGAAGERLPNTSSLLIDGIDGESLLINLDIAGASVSTGAACASGNPEPSPVLLSMGLTREEAQRSLRVSMGIDTTRDNVIQFIEILAQAIQRLRQTNQKRDEDVQSIE